MDVSVTAETVVNPTEDETKVERALHNIFPSSQIQKTSQGDIVVLKVHGDGLDFLSAFRNLLRQERIRTAARSILFKAARGQHIRIYLNKQAAYMGRPSFCGPIGESPNGPISIEIDSLNPQAVIDFLASSPVQAFSRDGEGKRRR